MATLVLSHEDLLLHLAMHLTMAAGFVGHVRTLSDIAEVCRRHGDAIDWSLLVAHACAYGLWKPLYHSLRLARELVGADVPSRTLGALRASFGQCRSRIGSSPRAPAGHFWTSTSMRLGPRPSRSGYVC